MIPAIVLLFATSQISQELLYVCVALVAIAIVFTVGFVWNRPPWWRTTPTPRRQVDDAQDAITLQRLRKRHPEAFNADGSPKIDSHPAPDFVTEQHTRDLVGCPACETNRAKDAAAGVNIGPQDKGTGSDAREIAGSL